MVNFIFKKSFLHLFFRTLTTQLKATLDHLYLFDLLILL